jgi:hypothetical protein
MACLQNTAFQTTTPTAAHTCMPISGWSSSNTASAAMHTYILDSVKGKDARRRLSCMPEHVRQGSSTFDADVSQAYWTHRVHAHIPAPGKSGNMGRGCTNIDACHQAGRRVVDPLVSRQTHGSYYSRHDCIFSAASLCTSLNIPETGPTKEGSGRKQSLSIPSPT